MRDMRITKLEFPTVLGFVGGVITGTSAVFNDAYQPFWVALKVTIIVASFGFAAANLIGLVVVRHRRSSRGGDG